MRLLGDVPGLCFLLLLALAHEISYSVPRRPALLGAGPLPQTACHLLLCLSVPWEGDPAFVRGFVLEVKGVPGDLAQGHTAGEGLADASGLFLPARPAFLISGPLDRGVLVGREVPLREGKAIGELEEQ